MLKHSISRKALLIVMLILAACSSEEPVSTSGVLLQEQSQSRGSEFGIALDSVSSKPWLVTGGDVLIEIKLDDGIDPGDVRLSLNDVDVTSGLIETGQHSMQTLLKSLPEGDSMLTAISQGDDRSETLALTNYPISGPIISGPHEMPFYCQTEEFALVNGDSLGSPDDGHCGVATRVDYVYWSDSEQTFKNLPPTLAGVLPDDVAEIAMTHGATVPYVVRVETGTVNRAIYEIAMLHIPGDGSIDAWNRSRSWNGKLVYTHGGGCRAGWYQQGSRTGGVMRRGLFEQGYAVTSSTLNVFGQNCNDLLASETHIMVKERFIENYGVPVYTIATGASGGSYQSHQTADNYPGVFDGIIVGLSFPDVTSATSFTVADARLLNNYFTEINNESFTQVQQAAIAGFGSWASIANLSRGAARLDPVYSFDTSAEEQGGEMSIPTLESSRYHSTLPRGVRATVYDHTINVYGEVDGTGMAQRPLDNVGVQYGLNALNDGVISVDQFILLNRDIGGFDRDMNHTPQRHSADSQASTRAIESGRVLFGGAGLASTPIIDYRSYTDHAENGDIHMIVHQFSTRERLRAANGHSDNQVMQVGGSWGFTEDSPDMGILFNAMDGWISAIQNDESDSDAELKVVANKPVGLVDSCWDNTGDERFKIEVEQSYQGESRCNELYPAYPTPRIAAKAPLANNVISCHLRPVNTIDYAVEFTEEQFEALNRAFSLGVCDWSKGDKSNARHQGTWISFGPSPVNRIQ